MIRKDAFIFDMDGTLVDNMRFQYEAWQRFFAFNDVEMTLEEVKHRTSVGIPHRVVTDFFNENLTAAEISNHLDRKEAFFQELYERHFAPINGLHEFLDRAAQKNIPIALATGSDYRNIDFTLDKLNIRRFFKAIVGGDDVRHGKPHPESFLLAADRLGVAPQDCLVFEDSFGGIEAATRAGIETVALTTMHTRAELENLTGVVCVIDDYTSAELADLVGNYESNKYFRQSI